MRQTSFLAFVLAFALGACGSDPKSGDSSACKHVKLKSKDQTVYGSIDKPKNVDCKTAQTVVREWGSQQLGENYNAKLPAGWKCDGNSICRKGNSSVTMTIEFGG